MYWQCTDESLSPRRKQNHTTKFFIEVTQFYSFILSRRCLRRSGQSRREKNNKICVKIEFYFFSISSKNNVGGSVNHKIKKVWPYVGLVCRHFDKNKPTFDVLLFLLCCFFFVGWKLECIKIHAPSKMIAEFYAAPHFQLHKKV